MARRIREGRVASDRLPPSVRWQPSNASTKRRNAPGTRVHGPPPHSATKPAARRKLSMGAPACRGTHAESASSRLRVLCPVLSSPYLTPTSLACAGPQLSQQQTCRASASTSVTTLPVRAAPTALRRRYPHYCKPWLPRLLFDSPSATRQSWQLRVAVASTCWPMRCPSGPLRELLRTRTWLVCAPCVRA